MHMTSSVSNVIAECRTSGVMSFIRGSRWFRQEILNFSHLPFNSRISPTRSGTNLSARNLQPQRRSHFRSTGLQHVDMRAITTPGHINKIQRAHDHRFVARELVQNPRLEFGPFPGYVWASFCHVSVTMFRMGNSVRGWIRSGAFFRMGISVSEVAFGE